MRTIEEIRQELRTARQYRDVDTVVSIIDELKTFNTDESVVLSLRAQAIHEQLQLNIEKAISIYFSALEKLEGGSEFDIAECANSIGALYRGLGDYVKGYEYLSKALELYANIGDVSGIAATTSNIANIFRATGDSPRALEYLHVALKLNEQIGHENNQAAVFANLGDLYCTIGDNATAIQHLQRASTMYHTLDNKQGESQCQFSIGQIYQRLGRTDDVEQSFLRGMQLARESGDSFVHCRSIIYYALFLNETDRCGDALHLLDDNDELLKMVPPTYTDAMVCRACVHLKLGNYDAARSQFVLAFEQTQERNEKRELAEISRYLGQIAKVQGNLDDYVKYNEIFLRLMDETNSTEMVIRLATQEREREILRIESELARSNVNLATQTEQLASLRRYLQNIIKKANKLEDATKLITEKLDELKTEEVDWLHFKTEFTRLHPEFTTQLLNKHPNLTMQEVKMCQLARIGLKSQDIARILSLSERTVENHRFRLRKKFNLASNLNLSTYLQQLH